MLAPLFFAFQSLVAGETCPAPVDVEARVRTILHLPVEQELSEGFVVERHESGLYVELRGADSTLIGQRTLPAEGNCDELAQAAAVVLSAWLSDVHPDFAGALPVAEPAPVPAPEPVVEATPTPVPPPPPRVAPPAPTPPPPPRRLELGLGLGADASGSIVALSGVLIAGYVPHRGLGLSGFAAVSWPREELLGPGTVAWRRWPAGVGPCLRVATRGLTWDLSAGPAIGWLHFAGSNFQHSSSQDGVAWGGFLDLRVASRGRHVGAFGLLNAQFFPGDSGASASGPGGPWSVPVPSFSAQVAVGAWLSP